MRHNASTGNDRLIVDEQTARQVAHYSHVQQRDRAGHPIIEHVERVAASLPGDERAIAYLHDVLEWTDTPLRELRAAGLTEREERILDLLTRRPGESFELHAARIAAAAGAEGTIARDIRLADLDDHLAQQQRFSFDAPPYAWARRRISVAQQRACARQAAG
jgi:hypothetical protein